MDSNYEKTSSWRISLGAHEKLPTPAQIELTTPKTDQPRGTVRNRDGGSFIIHAAGV